MARNKRTPIKGEQVKFSGTHCGRRGWIDKAYLDNPVNKMVHVIVCKPTHEGSDEEVQTSVARFNIEYGSSMITTQAETILLSCPRILDSMKKLSRQLAATFPLDPGDIQDFADIFKEKLEIACKDRYPPLLNFDTYNENVEENEREQHEQQENQEGAAQPEQQQQQQQEQEQQQQQQQQQQQRQQQRQQTSAAAASRRNYPQATTVTPEPQLRQRTRRTELQSLAA